MAAKNCGPFRPSILRSEPGIRVGYVGIVATTKRGEKTSSTSNNNNSCFSKTLKHCWRLLGTTSNKSWRNNALEPCGEALIPWGTEVIGIFHHDMGVVMNTTIPPTTILLATTIMPLPTITHPPVPIQQPLARAAKAAKAVDCTATASPSPKVRARAKVNPTVATAVMTTIV